MVNNNKSKLIYAFVIVLSIVICGCKTENEFTRKVDKMLTSQRYKDAIFERDELCNNNGLLRSTAATLGQHLIDVQEDYNQLDEKYKTLSTTSGMKLAQLNEDLKDKSKELEKKEKLLQEREQRLKEMQAIISRQDSVVNNLNNIVKNALLGFNADELSVEMKNGKVYVYMSDKLLFKSGSADVESKGKDALRKLAEVLNKSADVDILIEGHTDNVPIKTVVYKDNWDLSAVRATSVVRLLTNEYAVDPKRLTASGKGENFPIASNLTSEGKAKNRRTEIILSPKLDELFKILETRKK